MINRIWTGFRRSWLGIFFFGGLGLWAMFVSEDPRGIFLVAMAVIMWLWNVVTGSDGQW